MAATRRGTPSTTRSSAIASRGASPDDNPHLGAPPKTLVSFDRPVSVISASITSDPELVAKIATFLAAVGTRQNKRKFSLEGNPLLMVEPSAMSHEEVVANRNTRAETRFYDQWLSGEGPGCFGEDEKAAVYHCQ